MQSQHLEHRYKRTLEFMVQQIRLSWEVSGYGQNNAAAANEDVDDSWATIPRDKGLTSGSIHMYTSTHK